MRLTADKAELGEVSNVTSHDDVQGNVMSHNDVDAHGRVTSHDDVMSTSLVLGTTSTTLSTISLFANIILYTVDYLLGNKNSFFCDYFIYSKYNNCATMVHTTQ